MKSFNKRLISLLLALVMACGMLPSVTIEAFAAEQTEEQNAFAGKKVSILSHSMSTYVGVSNDTGANSTIGDNDIYYTEGRLGVYQKDTWWQQVIDALDMELLVNNSWSGSCIFMPRKGEASVGYGDRAVNLHNDHTGEEPDIIFVYLGCNDFAYYKDTFGKAADVDYSALIADNGDGIFTYAEPTTTCEAYAIMLHKVENRYPDAEIYCMTSTARREVDYEEDGRPDAGQPTEYSAQLHKVAQYFGYPIIDLENAIPKDVEIFDLYIGDKRAHANALGMDQITNEVLSVMLGEEAEICHVTSDSGAVAEQAVLLGGSYTAEAIIPEESTLTVTMSGVDITAEAYQNGTITIAEVTGDIEVSVYTEHTPKSYQWIFEDGELVSAGENENTATKLSGTVADGVISNGCYAFDTAIVLQHDRPWVLEWKLSGDWGGMLFSSTYTSKTDDMRYISRTKGGQVCLGTWLENAHRNYGVDLSALDDSAHVYRLENHITEDGSNTVWMYVDGTKIGAMNNYYLGSTYQSTDSDWVCGKDFVFSNVGTSIYPLNNCALEYISVAEDHFHTYTPTVTAPTCTERGYTTYTCACGDSYADDYVDATGHTYENGTCAGCGATKKAYQRLTYFTVDVQAENGKTYTDNAVLYLPENYTADGEPVKLIIYCKQGSSTITASSNPIESVGFYNYLLDLGYAILGVDGMPDAWRDELGLDETRVVGNPLAVQGTEKAYDYVIENYNIAADGCFISGYSQGGHYAQNVIDLTDIPILAAAEQSPVCSMRYHQWDLAASKTVGGVAFTKAARLNVARIYGFPEVTTNAELLNLAYDSGLVAEYDPWVRNSENVYTDFVQSGNLWYLPDGTSVDDIAMTHTAKCPVKIWCAEDDTAVSADVIKVFVKAIQNAGGTAEISVAESGGHGFFTKQTAVGTFTENGKQYNTLPIAVEIAEWFAQFGGYECTHTYENGSCTACGAAQPGPVITKQPESVQAAIGEKFTVKVEAQGEGLSYQWYYKHKNSENFTKSSFKSSSYAMTMATYCHNREIYCVITDANGNSVRTDTVLITAPLTITKQPADVEVAVGEKFSISVQAVGDGLSYQWYYSGNGGKSFAVSSFKGKSYSMTMQEYCHNRQVYCVITDAYGNAVTSQIATITRPPVELMILSQPQDVQAEIGQRAAITVRVQGDGLTYQWYYKNAGSKNFAKSSFNGNTYAMTMAEFCHNRQVYCVVTDQYGNSVTTEIATMSRPPLELKILEQPADAYAAMGEKFNVSFSIQGEGLTYQWYYKDTWMADFKASSFKSRAYSMTMAGFQNNRQVYCVITDQYGNSVTTEAATIHLEG